MRWPSPPLVHIAHRTHRLIASRYPAVGIFEELVSPGDAAAALELELLTGDQARPERLLPKEKIVYGVPGATLINAAFVYTSPSGGRFNRPVLGAWYCALALETAIREVLEGRSYVTPLITEDLLGTLLHPGQREAEPGLTARQREILQLLADGRSMREIGQLLDIAPRTVAFHKYRMMRQLKVKSTAELIQYAVKHHVV